MGNHAIQAVIQETASRQPSVLLSRQSTPCFYRYALMGGSTATCSEAISNL